MNLPRPLPSQSGAEGGALYMSVKFVTIELGISILGSILGGLILEALARW